MRETFEIDKFIVEVTGRSRPWTLCITAAAEDDPAACDAFGYIYGDSLRCRTDYLRLLKGDANGDDFIRKIARSEIIYFSNGDAELLVNTLRRYGVDEELRKAYARGVIFCGVGAGATCWGKQIAKKTPAEGLNYVDFVLGVNGEIDALGFSATVNQIGEPGLLLDSLNVLHVRGDEYRVFSPGASAKVRKFLPGNELNEGELITSDTLFRPLSELTQPAAAVAEPDLVNA